MSADRPLIKSPVAPGEYLLPQQAGRASAAFPPSLRWVPRPTFSDRLASSRYLPAPRAPQARVLTPTRPVLPPHTSLFGHRTGTKLKGGRESPRNWNNWFRKKARHLRKQVRCRLSERAFNAGRVSVISQHQPLLYDNQLYLPTASRGSDTQYRRPLKHDVAGSSALRRCPWR